MGLAVQEGFELGKVVFQAWDRMSCGGIWGSEGTVGASLTGQELGDRKRGGDLGSEPSLGVLRAPVGVV